MITLNVMKMIFIKNIYKSILRNRQVFCLGLLILGSSAIGDALAQERVRMKFYYEKNDAGERMFTLGLSSGSGRSMRGVPNAEIVLSAEAGDTSFIMATLETDTLGEVVLYLDKDYVLPIDENGVTTLTAEYAGDEEYRSVSGELMISDLDFEFSFEEIDSVKYLKVFATRVNGGGEKIPVEELSINIGIERLFSILPLEQIETDEDGIAELEIPDDLPGDANGMLTFVARIEDNDEFGSVTEKGSYNWGIPVSYELKPLPRQLFTDEAPLWMIVSVFVILLGAWYHFFLSISKLIKLKKAA
jgi:hypothetical protein